MNNVFAPCLYQALPVPYIACNTVAVVIRTGPDLPLAESRKHRVEGQVRVQNRHSETNREEEKQQAPAHMLLTNGRVDRAVVNSQMGKQRMHTE
ncbi:hypothetical protein PoB_002423200 [Plakobranchus ocellatus]|uniref:Uncharacterized protein n=1 Tax=Plakobranchus ocellatus TaxID=259542 RepID=A0AAV3ZRE8_9GAST|nr:hypothetical protein PoB_002423200 [Plakobranchus ocellatus]